MPWISQSGKELGEVISKLKHRVCGGPLGGVMVTGSRAQRQTLEMDSGEIPVCFQGLPEASRRLLEGSAAGDGRVPQPPNSQQGGSPRGDGEKE